MPNYDFKCTACDNQEELNVKHDEVEKQTCSICSKPLARRWTFKGSVWAPTATGGGAKV